MLLFSAARSQPKFSKKVGFGRSVLPFFSLPLQ